MIPEVSILEIAPVDGAKLATLPKSAAIIENFHTNN
jgi:hypothetical protein